MTDKILTLATVQDAADMSAAIFKKYQADQLAARQQLALDIDRKGRVLVPQITSSYTGSPPPVTDPNTRAVITPSDPKALLVDATVQAMQGAKVDIGGGKIVTIDVSAATTPAVAAGDAMADVP